MKIARVALIVPCEDKPELGGRGLMKLRNLPIVRALNRFLSKRYESGERTLLSAEDAPAVSSVLALSNSIEVISVNASNDATSELRLRAERARAIGALLANSYTALLKLSQSVPNPNTTRWLLGISGAFIGSGLVVGFAMFGLAWANDASTYLVAGLIIAGLVTFMTLNVIGIVEGLRNYRELKGTGLPFSSAAVEPQLEVIIELAKHRPSNLRFAKMMVANEKQTLTRVMACLGVVATICAQIAIAFVAKRADIPWGQEWAMILFGVLLVFVGLLAFQAPFIRMAVQIEWLTIAVDDSVSDQGKKL